MGFLDFLTTKKQPLCIYNENKTLLGCSEPLEKKSKRIWKKIWSSEFALCSCEMDTAQIFFQKKWHSATKSDTAQDNTMYTNIFLYLQIYKFKNLQIYNFTY